MSNELHTMPLKVEKFLSSARVRMMKWDEKGVYALLLMEAWLTGGKLQNDKEGIRRLLNVSEDAAWSDGENRASSPIWSSMRRIWQGSVKILTISKRKEGGI